MIDHNEIEAEKAAIRRAREEHLVTVINELLGLTLGNRSLRFQREVRDTLLMHIRENVHFEPLVEAFGDDELMIDKIEGKCFKEVIRVTNLMKSGLQPKVEARTINQTIRLFAEEQHRIWVLRERILIRDDN